ncbi:3-keto-disaccharide hydrolase [Planctomicrobium piriforme]|uniref:3-keto-alpha-glucoside-1,2-lyase/3-keto-2-hydroxy-glucal hydratase domain-containing protein n=1 Tax=Planctomicrobium piriforme TaxID=1576369 RepID=A0A1I3GZ87_9PLAN|nr:DUF1080 domain-containing protein [Planctomicrobium piriforme]SFI28686.1 protein of unknown function [Planctomicrobium piriforme]
MSQRRRIFTTAACALALIVIQRPVCAEEALPGVVINGTEPGWKTLTLDDFTAANCDPDTWSMRDGMIHCTGQPIGVVRSKDQFTNLELMVEWRHEKSGGNSGVFMWASPEALENLPRNKLPPGGIEIQILDHGYTELYEKSSGKKGDWFTTNGDVFPVGRSKMKPFPPLSPSGERSFPTKQLSKGIGEWNHYYVRAINGEVRLWVNGTEVSGGNNCQPATGYLCLESEGAPIDFRNLKVRVLP